MPLSLRTALSSTARAIAQAAREIVAPFRTQPTPPVPPETSQEAAWRAVSTYAGQAPQTALLAAYEVGCLGALVGTEGGGLGVRGELRPVHRRRLEGAGFRRVIGDGPEEWIWMGASDEL